MVSLLEQAMFFLFRPNAIMHKTHLSYRQEWFLAWKSRFSVLPSEFRLPKQNVPILISGWGWGDIHDGTWRRYAVASMEKGSKLIAVQHGGGYGMRAYAQCELHEKRVSDEFWGWGWAEHNVALPEMKIRRSPTCILFISAGRLTPICRLDSEPLFDEEWKQHFDWQGRFFAELKHYRESVVYRRYPDQSNASGEDRIHKQYPEMRMDWSQRIPLNKAWLVVIDHIGTPMLNAMRSGIPTILFWNPKLWSIRPEAAPYFHSLEQCGILHFSPESAAHQVKAFDLEWWNSQAVQQARQAFIQRFAWTEKDWTRSWIENVERLTQRPSLNG